MVKVNLIHFLVLSVRDRRALRAPVVSLALRAER